MINYYILWRFSAWASLVLKQLNHSKVLSRIRVPLNSTLLHVAQAVAVATLVSPDESSSFYYVVFVLNNFLSSVLCVDVWRVMHDCKWWGMMCHTSPLQCNHHNKFWIIGDTGQYWLFHLSQSWWIASVLVSLPGYCEINDWPPLQHRSIPGFTQSYTPVIEGVPCCQC